MTVAWRKSSYSGNSTDEMCVEVAGLGAGIGVRDSRDPDGGRLVVDRGRFGGLLEAIKHGALDRTAR